MSAGVSPSGVTPFNIHPNEIPIIAVRHGEGERNHRGTHIQGWIDDPNSYLNETGLAQAEIVGKTIAAHYPETVAVYTFDLYRCLQTTQAIAGHFFILIHFGISLKES